MADKTSFIKLPEQRQLIMERTFDAPRDLVFEAWTNYEHLMNWWGPREWPLTKCEMDFRPGGTWLYCMTGPDNQESWGLATYKEINAPSGFTHLDAFADSTGKKNPNMPEMDITNEFIDEGGKTTVRSVTTFPTAEAMQQVVDMGVESGFGESLDRLDEYLATKTA